MATSYQFLVTGPQVTLVKNGFTQVARDYAAWQADAVKHAVKPMFFAMNISEPAQYASIGQQVEDAMKDVRYGRKPIDAFHVGRGRLAQTGRRRAADVLRGHPRQARHRSVRRSGVDHSG